MRNIINSAEVSQHTIKLQQIGAKVQIINSTLCYVRFNLEGLDLEYVYNVNYKGNYFLERIKPYPLVIEEFDTEHDLVKLIEQDVNKFRNAMKSRHVERFISIAKQISKTFSAFEDTFLNYNIPTEKVDKIYKKILALEFEIDMIREIAKSIELNDDKNNT